VRTTKNVKDSRAKTKQQSKQMTLRVRLTIKLNRCCWTGKRSQSPKNSKGVTLQGKRNWKEMNSGYDEIKMVLWYKKGGTIT